MNAQKDFEILAQQLQGECYYLDQGEHRAIRQVYATDASIYQELPLAVTLPQSAADISRIIRFATGSRLTVIPRTAGTSLAGQVVGGGIVMDLSVHLNQILEVNQEEGWVRVEPGVIRDDLNAWLRPYGWMFGPETSTANRAMIGGMIGNNSCGLHSLIWGAARDHLQELKVVLSDGSEQCFRPLSLAEARLKAGQKGLEAAIYQHLIRILEDKRNQSEIRAQFPAPDVRRRNSGYALDALLDGLNKAEPVLDICKLIAGSEGTLCCVTEAKLSLLPLPPPEVSMVAIHCHSLRDALLANLIALRHACAASELVDDYILNFAVQSPGFRTKADFVEGKPKAILMVEFFSATREEAGKKVNDLIADLRENAHGYAYPVLFGQDTQKAWDLRKAGLGLIRNLPGDAQPVNLIEDSAVSAENLPDYIAEVEALLGKMELPFCVYAHAGPGELHIEPVINLKSAAGQRQLRVLLTAVAAIVKKYGGSLSGEHGDGRLRGEFIPFMMGEKIYDLFREVKQVFDPNGVFNRHKITDTRPMDEGLRYEAEKSTPRFGTVFNFSDQESMLRLSEKCSGSGDCRRSHHSGGLMCPSFMATGKERDTTRARANILRQFITENQGLAGRGEEEVVEILDLCLSCKGCKTECPSAVDMTRLKAEFMQQYYDRHGVPLRNQIIAGFAAQMRVASLGGSLYNRIVNFPPTRRLMNRFTGFHPERTMPSLSIPSLRKRVLKNYNGGVSESGDRKVYFFLDEFTNYLDAEAGEKAIRLMERLGYTVICTDHMESGRAQLSKGLVRDAVKPAVFNVRHFSALVGEHSPLVGIEPSAILSFRDEYPALVPVEMQAAAQALARHVYSFDEWFCRELEQGRVRPDLFNQLPRKILVHEHCHQKALSGPGRCATALSVLPQTEITLMPTGCCGMAGSFGYEKEHYDLSMKIGGLVLFPEVSKKRNDHLVAAAGTSCRHQIKDGTGVTARHSAEILYDALQ